MLLKRVSKLWIIYQHRNIIFRVFGLGHEILHKLPCQLTPFPSGLWLFLYNDRPPTTVESPRSDGPFILRMGFSDVDKLPSCQPLICQGELSQSWPEIPEWRSRQGTGGDHSRLRLGLAIALTGIKLCLLPRAFQEGRLRLVKVVHCHVRGLVSFHQISLASSIELDPVGDIRIPRCGLTEFLHRINGVGLVSFVGLDNYAILDLGHDIHPLGLHRFFRHLHLLLVLGRSAQFILTTEHSDQCLLPNRLLRVEVLLRLLGFPKLGFEA
mmetsp:Transcript_22244/g.63834  ORF Transcript_22244/g.63834 Transcript_22244/m.63834 type:complete len:268 (+) Transcript_22244:315-1118(+)